VAMSKKMHAYKKGKEQDKNPVLSNPFHKGSFLLGVPSGQKITLKI